MLLPVGYSDVPRGKIAAVVTHLEITERPAITGSARAVNGLLASDEGEGEGVIWFRHSGMRHRTRVYPSSALSLSKSATADLEAQARNP